MQAWKSGRPLIHGANLKSRSTEKRLKTVKKRFLLGFDDGHTQRSQTSQFNARIIHQGMSILLIWSSERDRPAG
jgi:hypothetical protein